MIGVVIMKKQQVGTLIVACHLSFEVVVE
jgi:hypothetical protein